ncbi:hypothetical protein KL908_004190 [Ogataea polymorpha]|nr:hypothetical protein KL908_004190 [Ogataea polymorpha]
MNPLKSRSSETVAATFGQLKSGPRYSTVRLQGINAESLSEAGQLSYATFKANTVKVNSRISQGITTVPQNISKGEEVLAATIFPR